ncbi:MAG: MGMT family protein [Candidatus Shapirobacteria bacterium]
MANFADRVYKILREVPVGRVTTYKVIAQKLGCKAYQAVGQALRNNPYAPEVPCHRVVRSDGRIGGFMGKTMGKEIEKKIKLLKSEGVKIDNGKIGEFFYWP